MASFYRENEIRQDSLPGLAAAQRYVDAFTGNAHLNGPIVLQYAAARTPAEQRPGYEARLADFLAEQQG